MTIELTDDEFIALVWSLQLTSAESTEKPEVFGRGTLRLRHDVRELSQRLVSQLPDVLARKRAGS